jgi:hypothetical protein
MIKAAIIVCFLCAATGGSVLWVKAHAANRAPSAAVDTNPGLTPGFWELHANAHLESMPVLPREPF